MLPNEFCICGHIRRDHDYLGCTRLCDCVLSYDSSDLQKAS